MIISSYNNQHGDSVTHTVEFDEHHFPKCYKVSVLNLHGKEVICSSMTFLGTKRGAKDSANYCREVIAVCEQRNVPVAQTN